MPTLQSNRDVGFVSQLFRNRPPQPTGVERNENGDIGVESIADDVHSNPALRYNGHTIKPVRLPAPRMRGSVQQVLSPGILFRYATDDKTPFDVRLNQMKDPHDEYANFVAHPRYGKYPRFTGLNPDGRTGSDAHMHWHSPKDCRIANTAILANRSNQNAGMGYVTHYFDVARCCVDCNRMFIFFAEEQRHWYEILKFNLSANCIRCVECRKLQRSAESLKRRYEQLLHAPTRSDTESLELAKCCLALIERSVFGGRAIQIVRQSLNQIPLDSTVRKHATFRDLWSRSNVRPGNGG